MVKNLIIRRKGRNMKLPIGISTFKEIREDYVYVDKTKYIMELINNHKYVFLSRPRRFGKSLLCDTLKELFEGNKELFNGLYIFDKYDFKKYPVIKISFGGIRGLDRLKRVLFFNLQDNSNRLGVECIEKEDAALCFSELIRAAAKKYKEKVVILIDEYDKPILDNIEDTKVAMEIREYLKEFYTEIKENDAYIKFCFITGVSKFAKVSIFSGLNNLDDISLDKIYSGICGYTQKELENVFGELLKGADLDKVREWYNGYNFNGENVYNPFDILLFISKGYVFNNYWFATGTPSFLIKLLKKRNYFLPQIEHLKTDGSLINSFDIEDIRLEPILFQSGYLTIDEIREDEYTGIEFVLRVPNREVQVSFNSMILDYFTDNRNNISLRKSSIEAFKKDNMDLLEENLKSLYASIPYNYFIKNELDKYEGYYASVFYAYIASLGLKIIAEDVTNRGRIDFTVKFNDKYYIFEFKVRDEDPLKQIKEKRYYDKYSGIGKEVVIIGIVFDENIRNIKQFVWEKV